MTRFYVCTTGIAKGPYQLSDIDKLDITTNDLVWCGDYSASRKAVQVPEFKAYFKQKQANNKSYPKKTPVYQRVVLVVLLSTLAAMIGYYYAVIN